MGRIGKKGKKKKTQNVKKASLDTEVDEIKNAPHSFVFYRGNSGDTVADLTRDFRKVMAPFTARDLKVHKKNKVKDFLAVAGVLHVSHMTIFTATENGTYMKIARAPRGPTLHFKILNYSLARDVISSIKKQLVFQKQFEHPPLVILNNFNGEVVQLKLMASMFQNMFPAINLAKINLNNVRRCVLFNYRSEAEEIDVRHFAIKAVPVGVSKGVKKIVQSKVPNLARFEDISEFITKSQLLSDSEVEEDPASHITLPQKLSSRGNSNTAQSSIRLCEQGPRMTLKLIKIEDGFMTGEVLYHRNFIKTEDEKALIVKQRMERRRIKEERKRIQAEKVKKKEREKEEKKVKSLEGMKRKANVDDEGLNQEEDDDAAWYKAEVGKEPEHDLFDKKAKGISLKRKASFRDEVPKKKPKVSEESGPRKKVWTHGRGGKPAKHSNSNSNRKERANAKEERGLKRKFDKRKK